MCVILVCFKESHYADINICDTLVYNHVSPSVPTPFYQRMFMFEGSDWQNGVDTEDAGGEVPERINILDPA